MLNWNDLTNLHVVKKTKDIIFRWWQVDVLVISKDMVESYLAGEKGAGEKGVSFTLQNPAVKDLFLQETAQSAFFERLSFVQKQARSASAGFLEKWPGTGLNLFIAPVPVHSQTAGFVVAIGFLYTQDETKKPALKQPALTPAGTAKKAVGKSNKELLPQSQGQKGESLAPKVPNRDKAHFMDLVETVAKEITSVQKEFLDKDHRIAETTSEPHSVSYGGMVGQSSIMRHMYNLLDKIKHSHNTILIQGENGTGKELIARSIHQNSPRKNFPFVAQNCSALNDNLLESELFGHVKGSFTGAYKDKKGLFEMAHQGAFFLDEVGDTSPVLQVKLLRVLQEGTFFPVGGTEPRKVDVRIIAATNRDLKKMVEEGTFREDLYYRLNVINIKVPALRDRAEDIALLAEFFINRFSQQPKIFTRKALDKLKQYSWPGNVRELQNETERLAIFTGSDAYIKEEFLSEKIRNKEGGAGFAHALSIGSGGKAMKKAIAQLERQMIAQCLKQEAWNKTKVAKKLGISRAALVAKVKEYKLDKRAFKNQALLRRRPSGL